MVLIRYPCFQHEIVWLSSIIKLLQNLWLLQWEMICRFPLYVISGRQGRPGHLGGFKFKYCLLWQEDEPANDSNLSVVIFSILAGLWASTTFISPTIIFLEAPSQSERRDDTGPACFHLQHFLMGAAQCQPQTEGTNTNTHDQRLNIWLLWLTQVYVVRMSYLAVRQNWVNNPM